jgi:hypothetical protein
LLWSVKAGNGWRGPAYHDGLVYLTGAQGTREPFRVVDLATGAIVNTEPVALGDVLLGGRYLFASGTVATAGRSPKVAGARNPWYEMSDRSVAFAGNRILVRTRSGVVCIGGQ